MNPAEISRLSRVRADALSGQARQIRLNTRVSLSELAGLCGVDPSTVWRWEQGIRVPRGEAALRYAQALEVLARSQAKTDTRP
ncbi:helix-turn-helix domain-containing protein [Streptomyces roseifaciens]